ncbi:DNA-directed RNA polymerase beta' subunit [Bacillus phage AR9]|uniref:DNA-directed RNA polymerase n=1 Tax=Bacillus phage AR9 TaxID=1815509 RepID=A0A172JIH0_BPPB1|nr:RNA polymerase beta subunit [Bacillus phage AR9]AMS01354.1 DNA-directed RNA polymerase beta' subunit [Bacillus phage AR9]WCS68399.1 DNA-directed RNA polymerase subunit beta' [Bacillus phage vB_BsuM-Goe21]7S01_d Chain d, DNA-directed RNA polymerase beta' subunit [Bacillus phage AR9]
MGKKLSLIDFNEIYNEENLITRANPIENHEFSDDGIYSERIFGSYNEDDDDKDIDTIGWINIEPYYIINPILFTIIKKCIPSINKIINYQQSIDQNGENIDLTEEIGEDDYIGLVKFKDNFDDLLEKYTDKKKYQKEYDFLIENHDKIFINKLPVFSHKLRPATLLTGSKGKVLAFDEINNYYNFVIEYINQINEGVVSDDSIDLLLLPLLYNMQFYANNILTRIISEYLRGKKGFLRKNIMGSRINFSARNVITPLIGHPIDEVAMPYKTFAELYKFQLINLISKVKGINYNEALKFWEKGILGFNQELYNYMEELITKTKGGCTFLLNRNPTISIGSILYLKIGLIKKDYKDLTLGISNNLLSALSGDYDGDVLNIIPVFDNKMKEHFSLLSPQNFLVDRNNGRFNGDFDLQKDQILGIFILNN